MMSAFQSTRPPKGATLYLDNVIVFLCVSIHAPGWGWVRQGRGATAHVLLYCYTPILYYRKRARFCKVRVSFFSFLLRLLQKSCPYTGDVEISTKRRACPQGTNPQAIMALIGRYVARTVLDYIVPMTMLF